MWRHNDINFNVLVTKLHDLLYNQCIENTCCYSFFIYPTGWVRVCKIRFVSTGENLGKPSLVCKKETIWLPRSRTWPMPQRLNSTALEDHLGYSISIATTSILAYATGVFVRLTEAVTWNLTRNEVVSQLLC